ncbi:MAG TPA: type VI secretion system protein [Candidatus Saccharimonadales bacterium]|jgi:type VI secretion system protein ImpL|nr:type VI secretion system protein [Candidatus Saccharimonadales bacterium]
MTALVEQHPVLWLASIALLVVLIIVVMLVVLWRMKKRQESAAKAPAEAAPESAAPLAPAIEAPQPRLQAVESQRQVAASMESGARYLRENSSRRGAGYDTPWFLAVGAPGSGKSAMLESSGIPFSLHDGAADFTVSNGIRWNFFRAGVVLDVPGRLFAPSGEPGADYGWNGLLRNLRKQRPRRPVDGVVLTIPCTEFTGAAAATPDKLTNNATQIAERLWQVRNQFGFSFPVYVVITKCDLVPGFSNFVAELPARFRNEMFGWSSPYTMEAAFDASWIDEAFSSLDRDLNRLQSEIFVEHQDVPSPEDLFLFSSKLGELHKPLLPYLARIFRPSAYREALQLRGIYFCGDAPDTASAGAVPERSHRWLSEHRLPEENVPGDVLGLSSAGEQRRGPEVHPVFVRDLFVKKIFPERGLARPVARAYASKDRTTRVLQWASLAAVLVLTAGVWVRYASLSKLQADTLVSLQDIKKALADPSTASLSHGDGPLDVMHALTGHNFKSVFLPASIIGPINDRVDHAMAPVFERIVYQQYEHALQQKVGQLMDQRVSAAQAAPGQQVTPAQAGAGLVAFSGDLVRLEENIGRYNILAGKDTGGVQPLVALSRYLGFHVHTEPVDNQDWRRVLATAQGKPFNPAVSRQRMLAKLHDLIDSSFSEWSDHNRNGLLKSVDDLSVQIQEFDGLQLRTYPELDRLRNSFAEVEKLTKDPRFAWMGKKEFQLPAEIEIAMRAIANRTPEQNPLLCEPNVPCGAAKLTEDARQSGAGHFERLKKEITASTTDLTDALLAPPDGDLQLSKSAARLRAALDSYVKLPLVEREGSARLAITFNRGSQLYWDKAQLQRVAAWKDSWEGFWKANLERGTDAVSENMQDAFREVAEASFMDGIAQAEHSQHAGASADSAESIAAEAQSFQDSAALLNTLLEQFDQMGFAQARVALEAATAGHAAALLERINQSFAARNLYTPGVQFQRWDGETAPAPAGFELQSSEEIPQYLALQLQQVRQYGAGARPIVEFLQQHDLPAGSRHLASTLAEWKRIVDDLQKYELKAPGNSLATLENFIAVDIDKVTPENCAAGGLAVGPSNAADYFVQRRESLRRSLYGRCRVLSEQNAERRYTRLAGFFNQRLAGRFPFAAPPLEQTPTEADPQDVRAFYQLLDGGSRAIRAGLQKGTFGAARPDVLAFINQMENLRSLFASLLPAAATLAGAEGASAALLPATAPAADAAPQFDFIPAFRVDHTPSPEINGNRIIEWTLQVGADSFQNGVPERLGHWNFGDPVRLTLRWAKDSPDIPKSYTPGSIVYEYRDPWSLLNMMLSHRAALRDPYPQTLVFTVPEAARDGSANGLQAKVYIRLKVRAPGKQENLPAPFFPWTAPLPAKPEVESAKGGAQ